MAFTFLNFTHFHVLFNSTFRPALSGHAVVMPMLIVDRVLHELSN